MSNKVLGDRGESCAARYLGAQGYQILAQKYRTKIGEIDLIAKDRDTLVFVEVKTRRSVRCGLPAEAVNYRKQRKIIQTAMWYLREKQMDQTPCRFDIVEVYAAGSEWRIHHLKGAFEV